MQQRMMDALASLSSLGDALEVLFDGVLRVQQKVLFTEMDHYARSKI